jgi:RNA polymerase sigma-70 factor (ECF subfamily)
MADGLQPALDIVDALTATAISTITVCCTLRVPICWRRNGSREEAAKSYLLALALVTNDRERGYLQRRLGEVQPSE